MNTVPAGELKRRGVAAIEERIGEGPVHVIRRNRPVCVVLSENDFARLSRRAEPRPAEQSGTPTTVAEWLALAPVASSDGDKKTIDARLRKERESWESR